MTEPITPRTPLRFQDAGAGPATLLVHGAFSNGTATWASQFATLTPHARLLVPDRRGHGSSPRDPLPYTVVSDAADLIDLLSRAQVETFHLVGHSYGGLVTIELARLLPSRVSSLHLIEPPFLALLPDDPDVQSLRSVGRQAMQALATEGPAAGAAVFFAALNGAEQLARLQANPAWPAIVAEASRGLYEGPPDRYPAGPLRALRLAGPTVVYSGGRSHPGLQKLARELATRIAGARLVTVPLAGHALHIADSTFDRTFLATLVGS